MISVKSLREIELMRSAGKITAETLMLLEESAVPGISTLELDKIAENYIRKCGAVPSFKNYGGFPGSICASVNDEVIHGIPSKNRMLREGDIISFDVGACFKGYHGDAARTVGIGKISDDAQKLIDVTKQSFFEGIEFCKPSNRVSDISAAVQKYAESFGYGVVRDYVGHGIGSNLHEAPEVPNFADISRGRGARLVAGMTIAIEPMINMGDYRVKVLDDDWTVKTLDGCLSAHYENTVLITSGKPEILTLL